MKAQLEIGTTIYVVASVKTEAEVTVGAYPGMVKLHWAEGQIGALTAFGTRKEAEAWANGCEIIEATVKREE